MIANVVWDAAYEGEAEVAICEFGIRVCGFGEGEGKGTTLDRLLEVEVLVWMMMCRELGVIGTYVDVHDGGGTRPS